ncbi:C-type lectin-like [Ruditapes philippinarum]|uniref:C-type lectin-like n=1 Tax=Ruditapes philippinarum TaxID=129788 RepID=UPI00295A8E3F|nr:C-type lectin-like [Ruditapes philippinarum]
MRRVENRMQKNQVGTDDVAAEMCRLHPCSEWSEWSKCDAIHQGEFGGQTRSRTCGVNTTLCKHYNEPINVIDTRLCEGVCPKDYTATSHGFCLKFYDKERLYRDDAEKVCQGDGGHLVNVDSEIKVIDVNDTILQQIFSADVIWIDGRKSVQGDPWTYGYKSSDPSFTFWGHDDPDNRVNDLCIMYHYETSTNNLWRWFDYPCDKKFAFICQYK